MISLAKKIVGYHVKQPTPPQPNAEAATPLTPITTSSEPDRRIVLKRSIGLAKRTNRFNGRAKSTDGFAAWSSDFYRIPPDDTNVTGYKFAISISHYVNGSTHPFEVWVLGREQPPMASVLCELLSEVLHSNDPPYIQYHLDALKKSRGMPFEITVPHTGQLERVGSFGAALAVIVEAHARHIGYFTEASLSQKSPMLEAMTSLREPKTEGLDGNAWYVDVKNPIAKHDCAVFVKTALLSDGSEFPFSLWTSGEHLPPEASAVSKLCSLAMRHSDPSVIADFLKTLQKDFTREHEFFAPNFGTEKQANYGSTWAAIADWLLYRYREANILNHAGRPVVEDQGELLFSDDGYVEPAALTQGLPCKECGSRDSLRNIDNCWTCVQCGTSKCG